MNPQAVQVQKLVKTFGAFTAVGGITFEVARGEIFGFLGPNGAGKSTTIKMLCGILSPTSGSGQVGGFDIEEESEKIKENIGYMSQKFSLYDDLTVEENIHFYSGLYRIPREKKKERKEWVLRMAGLEEARSRRTSLLPLGWKQRLALGCAILHEPKILFLDEPTSGVDPISRQNFWKLIQEMASLGVTVFVTTHYMDEAENCNRAALIYGGRLIAMDSPKELKRLMKEEVLELRVPSPETWMEKIQKLDSVKESALFGSALHIVVFDSALASEAIKQLFSQARVAEFSLRKIQPSLEDVFVSLIEAHDQKSRKFR